jgi:hypothetical protein
LTVAGCAVFVVAATTFTSLTISVNVLWVKGAANADARTQSNPTRRSFSFIGDTGIYSATGFSASEM